MLLPTISYAFVLVVVTQLPVKASTCYRKWNYVDYPIAISMKPSFKMQTASFPPKQSTISWEIDEWDRSDHIRSDSIRESNVPPIMQNVEHTVERSSFNGTAKLTVRIDHDKLKMIGCHSIDINMRCDLPNRCTIALRNSANQAWKFIIFNRNSYMQEGQKANENSICFENLTPGTTYHICLASRDCQNSWNCGAFTTPENAKPTPVDALYNLDLYQEGVDSTWVQLSWPPPKFKRPATPPIGYVISVSDGEVECWNRTYVVTTPWATDSESTYLHGAAVDMAHRLKCKVRSEEVKKGDLDGFWPDFPASRAKSWTNEWNWGYADEQGPLGIFAFTVANLEPDSKYKIGVTPISHPDGTKNFTTTYKTVQTLAESPDVYIEAKGSSLTMNCYDYYRFELSEIGVNPIHCNTSAPTLKHGVPERFCYESSSYHVRKIKISLTPGTVYRLKIFSNKSSVTFQKVFGLAGDSAPYHPNIIVDALSSNLVNVRLTELNISVPNPMAYIVRFCKTPIFVDCKRHPLYRNVLNSYNLFRNTFTGELDHLSTVAAFNAPLRTPGSGQLHAFLHAYTGKEVEVSRYTYEGRRATCKSWCVFPASDLGITQGKPFGMHDRLFTRRTAIGEACQESCEPLMDHLNGETGCLTTTKRLGHCDVPLCNDVAEIGCVINAVSTEGSSWIKIEWENPRGFSKEYPNFLVLATSNYPEDEGICRIFAKNTSLEILPPFLRTVTRSCAQKNITLMPYGSNTINITNLAQDSQHVLRIIPYLENRRIGAVLEMNVRTKMALPCPIKNAIMRRNGSQVSLTWKVVQSRECSQPTSMEILLNGTGRSFGLSDKQSRLNFTYNFEYCRSYVFQLRLLNLAGMTTYPDALQVEIGYPDIRSKAPEIHPLESSGHLAVMFNSESPHCSYEYAVKWGILNDFEYCVVNPEIKLPKLQEGLVYKISTRIQPLGSGFLCDDNQFASNWSSSLTVPTMLAKSEVRAYNISVKSYIPEFKSNGGKDDKNMEVSGCLLPVKGNNWHKELRWKENFQHSDLGGSTSSCVIVDWTVEPSSASGILGYVVEFTQASVDSCRLIWIPCKNCFPNYGLRNALPEVLSALKIIRSHCLRDESDDWSLEKAERLSSVLYSSTTRVLLGFHSFKMVNGSLKGMVKTHVVKMGSIHQIMDQYWEANAQVVLSKTGVSAGIVVGILLAPTVLPILAILILRRRWQRIIRRDQYMKGPTEDELATELAGNRNSLRRLVLGPGSGRGPKNPPNPIGLSEFSRVLATFAKNDYAALRDEFETLQATAAAQERALSLTTDAGQHPENKLRNRYRRIVPYDQNRVELADGCTLCDICPPGEVDSSSEELPLIAVSDYVNASRLPSTPDLLRRFYMAENARGIGCPSAYIAAQAPKRCSVGLFWQAIWDSGVRLIVMLTRLHENDKEKCWRYWPKKSERDTTSEKENIDNSDQCSETYGKFLVTLQSTETGLCFIRRVLEVRNLTHDKSGSRCVVQLLMTNWDDFKVPRKDDFIVFLQKYWSDLKTLGQESPVPVLVHCSAGVGRTGTFIAIDIVARYVRAILEGGSKNGLVDTSDEQEHENRIKKEAIYENLSENGDSILMHNRATVGKSPAKVDIFRTVLWLRSQRMKMVYQDVQYIFIYDFINYYIQYLTGESDLTSDNM